MRTMDNSVTLSEELCIWVFPSLSWLFSTEGPESRSRTFSIYYMSDGSLDIWNLWWGICPFNLGRKINVYLSGIWDTERMLLPNSFKEPIYHFFIKEFISESWGFGAESALWSLQGTWIHFKWRGPHRRPTFGYCNLIYVYLFFREFMLKKHFSL